jgi:hypothetical protein
MDCPVQFVIFTPNELDAIKPSEKWLLSYKMEVRLLKAELFCNAPLHLSGKKWVFIFIHSQIPARIHISSFSKPNSFILLVLGEWVVQR